jgi:hypothetical protein
MYVLQMFVRDSKLSFSKRKTVWLIKVMEASTREASQTPKLYDHSGANKTLCGNILDSLKQKMNLQLKPT